MKFVTMVVTHRLVHTVVAVVLCATVADAQTADPREGARTHLGPFYLTPSIAIEELGLDTNIFNNETERADFTMTFVPGVKVAVPFQSRGFLMLSTSAEFIYYQHYASERSINPDLAFRGQVSLNRVTLFIAPTYTNSRRQPSLEIDERIRHQNTNISGGAIVRVSERLSTELSGGVANVNYDEGAMFDGTSLRDALNRTTQSVALSIQHEVTPLTSISVRTQYSEERFPFSPGRDADSITLLPGVEFKPLALISGSAAVGVRRFRPQNQAIRDYTGVVAHASLVYSLQGFTRFRFTADRDLAFSYSEAAPYYLMNSYGVGVDRHIAGRFDVTGGLNWLTHNYQTIVGLEPLPESPFVDRLSTWSVGVGYRLARSRRMGFDVTYRERGSAGDQFRSYSGLRLMWSLDSGL